MGNIVIKCGGSVIEEIPPSFYRELCEIQAAGKFQPIIVHGGGKLITNLLFQLKIPSVFVKGLRVTTDDMLDVIEMALSGNVNKSITRSIIQAGGQAVGISGIDGGLLEAKQVDPELGFTGYVKSVNSKLIKQLCDMKYIPVVSPLGMDIKGQRYNINADTSAAAIAGELQCPLLLISDIPGIYQVIDGEKQTIDSLSIDELDVLIDNGTITDGMIPKVNGAKEALLNGVKEVVIMDGRQENALTLYCNQQSIGTKIYKKEEILNV
ncbi:acetylglutamate kinase [Paenisporosarcina sp. TG20]|uniref:acetylglutamate kinase n=1 Tax=Paenisporosarcina sp. TG20 TaxID=1211706 RepID=UPI0002E2E533|nr:acetylglutamate kinase [Paenisporosarcina sp. TG20]